MFVIKSKPAFYDAIRSTEIRYAREVKMKAGFLKDAPVAAYEWQPIDYKVEPTCRELIDGKLITTVEDYSGALAELLEGTDYTVPDLRDAVRRQLKVWRQSHELARNPSPALKDALSDI